MLGLMQDWPLTLDKVFDHASVNYPDREIVTRSVEGPIVRSTYAQAHERARRLSSSLRRRFGVRLGDRVATLAWNTVRHFETWYAAANIGAVYHTLNPLWRPEQLVQVVNEADDQVIMVDLTFLPLLEKLQPYLEGVRGYVIYTDDANMPETTLPDVVDYETLISEGNPDVYWGGFDERTAAGLCYTSGTTGHPKGVLYSHRSNVVHAMALCAVNGLGVGDDDVVLPVVPMFHANGWGAAFVGPMAGAKLVMPGPRLDGAGLCELIAKEGVTVSAAVPMIWLGLLNYLEQTGARVESLRRVVIGGSAVPETMVRVFADKYGVEVVHAWGMTETSPLGAVSRLAGELTDLPDAEREALRLKQGRAPFTVEMKTVGREGATLPRDGRSFGVLKVRGPAVAKAYFGDGPQTSAVDAQGWLDTGDMATIDARGFMAVVDRVSDVINSGGEWISSITLENLAIGHPKVAEACAIGVPHPKWGQRPLLLAVLHQGETAAPEELFTVFDGKTPKWWTPDEVIFVDSLPHTATGKLDKKLLRERYADHQLASVAAASSA